MNKTFMMGMALSLALLLSGCISYRADLLSPISSWPPPAPQKKRTATLVVKSQEIVNGKPSKVANTKSVQELTDICLKVYRDSGLFSEVRAEGPSDLQIQVDITAKEEFNETLMLLTGFIVPQNPTDDYVVRTTVTRSQGTGLATVIKDSTQVNDATIEKAERVETWVHLFLVFAMPFRESDSKVVDRTLVDLQKATLLELRNKPILQEM